MSGELLQGRFFTFDYMYTAAEMLRCMEVERMSWGCGWLKGGIVAAAVTLDSGHFSAQPKAYRRTRLAVRFCCEAKVTLKHCAAM